MKRKRFFQGFVEVKVNQLAVSREYGMERTWKLLICLDYTGVGTISCFLGCC